MQKYVFFNIPTNILTGSVKFYFLSSFKIENRIDCKKESNKLNSKAVQKLLTEKLSKNSLANSIMQALITSKKSPNVTIVIGKVRMTNKGFKKAFNKPKTMATIMAPVNPATSTPGRTYAKITTATAVSKILMIKFIMFFLGGYQSNIALFFYKMMDCLKKISWIFCMKPMSRI